MIFQRHPHRWLAPYAEGLLPAPRAGQIARHVLGCRRCRRALDLVRAGQRLVTVRGPAPAAALTWRELAPGLTQPADDPPRRHQPASPFRWALAVAVLLLAGALVARARGQDPLASVTAHRAAVIDRPGEPLASARPFWPDEPRADPSPPWAASFQTAIRRPADERCTRCHRVL
jgi:hypothetical protein